MNALTLSEFVEKFPHLGSAAFIAGLCKKQELPSRRMKGGGWLIDCDKVAETFGDLNDYCYISYRLREGRCLSTSQFKRLHTSWNGFKLGSKAFIRKEYKEMFQECRLGPDGKKKLKHHALKEGTSFPEQRDHVRTHPNDKLKLEINELKGEMHNISRQNVDLASEVSTLRSKVKFLEELSSTLQIDLEEITNILYEVFGRENPHVRMTDIKESQSETALNLT